MRLVCPSDGCSLVPFEKSYALQLQFAAQNFASKAFFLRSMNESTEVKETGCHSNKAAETKVLLSTDFLEWGLWLRSCGEKQSM